MTENQAEFKGWAKVEIMGHQSHIGYVTTEVYGQAVMFRVDRPAIPESDETLSSGEYIGDQFCRPGSVIKRAAVEPLSVLLGAGTIYRIIPCDEAAAMKAVWQETRRPLSVVKLVAAPRLSSASEDPFPNDEEA